MFVQFDLFARNKSQAKSNNNNNNNNNNVFLDKLKFELFVSGEPLPFKCD